VTVGWNRQGYTQYTWSCWCGCDNMPSSDCYQYSLHRVCTLISDTHAVWLGQPTQLTDSQCVLLAKYCFFCSSVASLSALVLVFFLAIFLLPYWSFPLGIDPLCFQAGCRERRLNLALVFLFILCCSTFLLIGEWVLLLCLVYFCPYQAKRLAWGNVSEMTYFVSSAI